MNPSNLDGIVNNACAVLPKGYSIAIFLENGAGSVELYLPDNEFVRIDSDYDEFHELISEAVEMAFKHRDAAQPQQFMTPPPTPLSIPAKKC